MPKPVLMGSPVHGANRYDVIVVGAGPAGSLAAKYAASGGAKTLLIEKHNIIGSPVCCAEAISTMGLSRSVPIDPKWIRSKVQRVVISGPGGSKLTIQHPDAGFVLDRKIFDRDLAIQASRAGAEVKVNCQATGLIKSNSQIKGPVPSRSQRVAEGFSGVQVLENQEPKEYYARIIIAADGVESQVGRWAGLDTTLPLGAIDSCCQYLLGGLDIPDDLLEFYFGHQVAPGGYIWVFPKGNGTANVGIGITPGMVKGKSAKQFLDEFVARRFPKYTKLEIMVGGVPTYRGKKYQQLTNLLLVGDAARVVDSLSGGGIANALLSGKIAGEVAAEFVKGNFKSYDFLEEYPRRFMKIKGRELRYYLYARHIFCKMTDADLDFVLNYLNPYFDGKPVAALKPIDTIKDCLKARPKLLLYARHIKWYNL